MTRRPEELLPGEAYMRSFFEKYLGVNPDPFEWTQSFGDQLALHSLPEDLVRRLRRFCEANPVGAEELVKFVVEVFDAGSEAARLEQ